MSIKLRFRPISFSWVAVHPEPKGVIQFIAGAFFGTFVPNLFYRNLLHFLFEQGYTIVLLPYDFTFNHLKEASFLMEEQYRIIPEIIRIAKFAGYEYKVYFQQRNFSWIGHSLGCKYIALLEALSSIFSMEKIRSVKKLQIANEELLASSPADDKKWIDQILSKAEIKWISPEEINDLIQEVKKTANQSLKLTRFYLQDENTDSFENDNFVFYNWFIKDQASILLAPAITSTDAAIQPKFLADFIDGLGLGVKPTREQTFELIKKNNLFTLMGLVAFDSDNIARLTVEELATLKKPSAEYRENLPGGHLKPLGIRLYNCVLNIFDKPWLESVQARNAALEQHIINLLEKVKNLLPKV